MISLQELFNDHQLYHSEFQQDYLITIRAGGTVYGQYKQSLRELYKRYRGLRELYTELELSKIDADEYLEKCTDERIDIYERRRCKVKHAQKVLNVEEIEKNIQDTEREFQRFYEQSCALKNNLNELTPEKRDMLDRDMWLYKLKEMAAIDFLSQGRLGNVTVEMIASTPINMRREILSLIRPDKQKELIEWFETKDNSENIAVLKLDIDIRKLLE